MYSSSSYAGQGIERIVGYAPRSPSFTLADSVNQAYSCEGCQKILGKMYGKEDHIEIPHPSEPSHHSDQKEYQRAMDRVANYHGGGSNGYSPVLGGYADVGMSPYNGSIKESDSSYQKFTRTYGFGPDIFLKPNRPETPFVENENQIMELAKETFLQLTGIKLPKDVSIAILPKEELKRKHEKYGKWSEGIAGFAINSSPIRKVFVKQDHLDSVMIVLGHEIGHIFTGSLGNSHDEEAKAFSFQEAWVRCIKKHDIGNLASSIKGENEWLPAQNGLHDVAFGFVKRMMAKGLAPMDLHWDLAKRYRSLFNAYQ